MVRKTVLCKRNDNVYERFFKVLIITSFLTSVMPEYRAIIKSKKYLNHELLIVNNFFHGAHYFK